MAKKGKSAKVSRTVLKTSATAGLALEALREVLSAIPQAEWRAPNMPIAKAFQEAQDLAAFLGGILPFGGQRRGGRMVQPRAWETAPPG